MRGVTGYSDTIPIDGTDPKDPQKRRISIVVVSAATEAAEKKHQKAQPREKPAPAKH